MTPPSKPPGKGPGPFDDEPTEPRGTPRLLQKDLSSDRRALERTPATPLPRPGLPSLGGRGPSHPPPAPSAAPKAPPPLPPLPKPMAAPGPNEAPTRPATAPQWAHERPTVRQSPSPELLEAARRSGPPPIEDETTAPLGEALTAEDDDWVADAGLDVVEDGPWEPVPTAPMPARAAPPPSAPEPPKPWDDDDADALDAVDEADEVPEATEALRAQPAPLWRRVAAWAVDLSALGALLALFFVVGAQFGKPNAGAAEGLTGLDALAGAVRAVEPLLLPGAVLLAALALTYTVVFARKWGGRTLGRRLLGLRLVDASGLPPSSMRAGVRAALSLVSFGLFLFGFWMALFDRRGQTLHDKLTSTFVVLPLS